jgi:hypothetical protein
LFCRKTLLGLDVVVISNLEEAVVVKEVVVEEVERNTSKHLMIKAKKYLVNVEAEVAIIQDHFVVAGQPILTSLQKHLLVKMLRITNMVKSPKVK